jgi:hypothetical protein
VPAPITPFTNNTYATPNPGYSQVSSERQGSSQPETATAGDHHHHQQQPTTPDNTPLTAVTPAPAASNSNIPKPDWTTLPSQQPRGAAAAPEIARGQITAAGVTQIAVLVLPQVTAPPRPQPRLRRVPSYWDLRGAARAQDAQLAAAAAAAAGQGATPPSSDA